MSWKNIKYHTRVREREQVGYGMNELVNEKGKQKGRGEKTEGNKREKVIVEMK